MSDKTEAAYRHISRAYTRAGIHNTYESQYRAFLKRYEDDDTEDDDTLAELAVLEVTPWLNPSWSAGCLMLEFDE